MVRPTTDIEISTPDVAQLTSADSVAEFFASLGYNIDDRQTLTPESIGLTGDAANAVRAIEVVSDDEDGFLRVLFVRLKSLTAKARTSLARVLGRTNVDHLLVLASDFATLEFVLLDKLRRESRGPAGGQRIRIVPRVVAVDRKSAGSKELRTLRRLTWTARDGLEQFDKLKQVFEAAAFSEDYFCNKALFADHYLKTRLRDDSAWNDNPAPAFTTVKELFADARSRWSQQGEAVVRKQLFEPVFDLVGFTAKENKQAGDEQTTPDYLLNDNAGNTISAAFTYAWDRWLDGPDYERDADTPDENPGACVVSALEDGVADWIIVTNGRVWRLYWRQAHSRATNFYEVDLPEALVASGDTDPNEAFRYWWLFFRAAAFAPDDSRPPQCWLDRVAEGSSDYAKELGERLKDRIFKTIFPHLARGFLDNIGDASNRPSEELLDDVFEATLALLYRLLFLLYAESRDLLPVREAPYYAASLQRIKREIAEKAGVAQSEAEARIRKNFSKTETGLYDRLQQLFAVMDLGDAGLNVPTYNGGLFITRPDDRTAADAIQERELRIARFLNAHQVPDRALALAIDLLSRDEDPKTFSLVFIDYKSLAVRHLGSIYEGLLEFRLKIAAEDLATKSVKGTEKYIPLSKQKASRKRQRPEAVVEAGDVYLSNDKAERKASGSYYTPDPIVEYIIEQTIGPVLAEKMEGLRNGFRNVRKTYNNEVEKATAYPVKKPDGDAWDPREFALEKVHAGHKHLVEQLFDFRTLDPAMGSGHFLVQAVDFITDRVLNFLNQFPVNPVQVMLDRTRKEILAALEEQGVTVDPDELTNVHLLKRHVLKRCIYGVDLNPMAVELAKVSLWLDAFTLGAPLSFLNHHLRCGNSLIGGTMAELKQALSGRLFGIDYAAMERAIQHVLMVNKMADATADEVKQSADQYDKARRELSGYRIVLDLLTAQHFDYPEAPDILTHAGNELDLSTRSRFEETLSVTDRLLVQKVAEVAKRPELRFFHWEIEFPEVFYGYADANERVLKRKDEIAEGSAGFDAVVGNPPYVRTERLPELIRPWMGHRFPDVHSGKADIYFYFIQIARVLSNSGAQFGLIVANAWLQTAAGESLRKWLPDQCDGIEVIDFESIRPFPDADMRPSIVRWDRALGIQNTSRILKPDEQGDCRIGQWTFAPQVAAHDKLTALATIGWSNERWKQPLIHTTGDNWISLGELCGRIFSGIKPGATRAFVVPAATAREWSNADPDADSICRPLFQGKHLQRFEFDVPDRYILLVTSEADFDKVSLCKRHLTSHRQILEKRDEVRNGGTAWYSLRTCDYLDVFAGNIIAWPDTAKEPRFCELPAGSVIGDTAFCIEGRHRWILPILNSQVGWSIISRICQSRDERAGRMRYRLKPQFLARFPIPKVTEDERKRFADSVGNNSSDPSVCDRIRGLYQDFFVK